MDAELDGILELVRVCTGTLDPISWITDMGSTLRVRSKSGKLDERYTRVWHSPHLAAEEVHMVVAVEWTKCKVERGFGFFHMIGYSKKIVFQGEFYLIRADNKSEPAKELVGVVQNVKSMRELYHEGIQMYTADQIAKYVKQVRHASRR
jgi:hypothetical protein